MLPTVLFVILILMLVGARPTWPRSRGWDYYPSGGIRLVPLIIVLLLLTVRFWLGASIAQASTVSGGV